MKVHADNLALRYTEGNSATGIDLNLAGCYLSAMSTSRSEVRRIALAALISANVPEKYATQADMAEALGFSSAHFSQLKSGNRPVGNDSADKIESALGLPMGSMDVWLWHQPGLISEQCQRDQSTAADPILSVLSAMPPKEEAYWRSRLETELRDLQRGAPKDKNRQPTTPKAKAS
jgi:transcriptional regulator with XRE-family HTH domain